MSRLTFLLSLSRVCANHMVFTLPKIQKVDKVSATAALGKGYEQKENIWIRLEEPVQLLLDCFSKR